MSWVDEAPSLAGLEPEARARLETLGPQRLPLGTTLFRPGDAVQGYAVVLSGRVDVTLTGATGRGILLYAVEPGQSCIQSTMGLLGGDDYTAEARTVAETRLVMLPRAMFLELIDSSAMFRGTVFHAFAQRMQSMMQLLERVAFQRVECRLAERLLMLDHGAGTVRVTQADLAAQVGSAREVISRRLDAWGQKGWVRTGRGTVTLLDRDALERLSRADT